MMLKFGIDKEIRKALPKSVLERVVPLVAMGTAKVQAPGSLRPEQVTMLLQVEILAVLHAVRANLQVLNDRLLDE